MNDAIVDHLLSRRSVVAKMMSGPGPDSETLAKILTAGARVPDHKILMPWRFLVFEGEAREKFGTLLAAINCLENPDEVTADTLEADRCRFTRVPVVIAVISEMKDTKPVPHWEQILSAGAVCQNLLIAATALGFAAQWITEWPAYSDRVRPILGLTENERVAGFVYIGTAREAPKERARPDMAKIVRHWQPPEIRP